MKIRDLLAMEIDIDCFDDVTEELAIAFCGPMVLTEEGEREFSAVLDCPVKMQDDYALICVSDEDDDVWEARLRKAKKLFYAMAGCCAESDYKRWFKEENI